MTQFNNELYAGFLPEAGDARFEGKRGFYPAMTAEEYRALPLPMKCATWDARVQYVIFDSYFRDYELSGKVEVHAENAFKALFRHSETDTQLYSVCAVRLFDGTRIAAKWVQRFGRIPDCNDFRKRAGYARRLSRTYPRKLQEAGRRDVGAFPA